jgi:pyruvate formate lyase activating enzyme
MLKDLVSLKLADYVAMDIKTTKEKYAPLFAESLDVKNIEESVDFLKQGNINFEFRTTVVPKVHAKEDFIEIAKWIGGPYVKYYLQNFRPEKTIDPNFENVEPYKEEYLKEIAKEISPYFKFCELR